MRFQTFILLFVFSITTVRAAPVTIDPESEAAVIGMDSKTPLRSFSLFSTRFSNRHSKVPLKKRMRHAWSRTKRQAEDFLSWVQMVYHEQQETEDLYDDVYLLRSLEDPIYLDAYSVRFAHTGYNVHSAGRKGEPVHGASLPSGFSADSIVRDILNHANML